MLLLVFFTENSCKVDTKLCYGGTEKWKANFIEAKQRVQ